MTSGPYDGSGATAGLTAGEVPPPPPPPPAMLPAPAPPAWDGPAGPPTLAAPVGWRERLRRFFAPIGAGLAALWKLKVFVLLAKVKFLSVALSMLVSIAAYAWLWDWKFAVGFVLLIAVHELGHVVVLRARRIKAGLPVFVPFMGAFVSMKSAPRTVYDEALSGVAGPLFGGAAAALVGWYGHSTGSSLATALAYTGFFLNLFNLLPVLPLDGGRTAAALHPAMWGVGLLGAVGLLLWRPTPLLFIVLLLGGNELWSRWRGRETAEAKRYHAIAPAQRAMIAVVYLGLVAALVVGMNLTYVHRTFS